MFERILIGGEWSATFFNPLTDDHPVCFKIADTLLIGANDGFAISFDEPIHKLCYLSFDLRELGLH